MDLLMTVRKEGSRGGRGDFKWSDVQSSTHRENYLGHSLMAPVGRWQTGRDLNWYAKGDASDVGGETSAEKAARERREEIKQIKEAEQDALARALGYDVPPRNPSLTSLGDRKEVDKMVKESVEDGDTGTGRGLGFGKLGAIQIESDERIEDNGEVIRIGGLEASRKNGTERRRNRSQDRRHRSRSQSRNRDRQRRRREKREDDGSRRSRSMSREHTRRRRSRSRSRHRDERGDQKRRDRRSYRSRSPYYSGRHSRGDYYDKRRP